MADERESGASADAEAPNGADEMTDEVTGESTPPEVESSSAEAEVLDAAEAQPEAAEEPESSEEPVEGPPEVEETADAPVAEAEPTEAPADPQVDDSASDESTAAEAEPAVEPVAVASAADDSPAPIGASDSAKRKRKRLPRALRPARTKTRRERPAERKPISRLPKPEHERGRRQERQGVVVSATADKTIVVRVDVVKAHRMYKKVIKRSTKLHAHDEANEAKVGDIVRIVETRPLSRMKRWRLQEIVEAAK